MNRKECSIRRYFSKRSENAFGADNQQGSCEFEISNSLTPQRLYAKHPVLQDDDIVWTLRRLRACKKEVWIRKNINSKTIEQHKEKLKLTDEQKEILVGLMLGDGCLETQNKGRTFRLKIEQSLDHQAYVHHLYHLFSEWVLTPPRIKEKVSKNSKSQNLAFQTVSHEAFRFFAHQYYKDGKKQVPKLIHRWLTPKAIAYWFMDDGSIKSKESKAVIFNTQGFIGSEVEILIKVLHGKFSLQANLRKQKDCFQIYISGKSFEVFVDLISPYLIEEMKYKLPSPRRTQLPKE